jgi:hypothetical protein
MADPDRCSAKQHLRRLEESVSCVTTCAARISPAFGVFPKRALHEKRYNPRMRRSNDRVVTHTDFLGHSVGEFFNFEFREPRIEANEC